MLAVTFPLLSAARFSYIVKRRESPRCLSSMPAEVEHSVLLTACFARRYIMQTYVRPKLVFTRGEGARMYDATGKEYLDFAAGIAVNALGVQLNLCLAARTSSTACCCFVLQQTLLEPFFAKQTHACAVVLSHSRG